MLSAEPEEVYGHQVIGPSGIDESFTAQLRFPNEVTAQFDSGFRSQFRMQMEIVGSEGSLFLPMAFKPDMRSHIYLSHGNDTQTILVEGNLLYLDEVEEMASRILDGSAPLLPLEDSRANIQAITALYDSARLGRPVTLP
jgi:predicted dehydrogenase